MSRARCVMAMECAKCGEVFDFSHDLRNLKESYDESAERREIREKESMLCWKCRCYV